MTSLQDAILSAFIERKTRQLKDTDVSLALSKQGIDCDPEDIRRHVHLLSPALFQLIFNTDQTLTIRVEPTVNQFFARSIHSDLSFSWRSANNS